MTNGSDSVTYDNLLIEAECEGTVVKEKNIPGYGGRTYGNRIAIHKDITTSIEKTCVLAEELGHYHTTVGKIRNQSITENRKQELHARLHGYNRLIGLNGSIRAYKHRCQSLAEMAEYLEVTENFLKEALELYRQKYGTGVEMDNYIVIFEPRLAVLEKIS